MVFEGGLELCTIGNKSEVVLDNLPSSAVFSDVIQEVAAHVMQPDKLSSLIESTSDSANGKTKLKIKNGVIVMINEADWEVLGSSSEDRYGAELENNSTVTFITTLHGG